MRNSRMLEIRDDLDKIEDIIAVCAMALLIDDSEGRIKRVAYVLDFQVLNLLKILDENIQEIEEIICCKCHSKS